MNSKKPYLKTNRLSDILALIQVLALDKHGHRSESGLQIELQGVPKSSDTWTNLAKEHPEFFRVDFSKEHKLALVARHVTEINEQGVRELTPDLIKKLIEIAIELHDRQQEKSGWWKVWLPLLVAIITVISSFFVQYKNNENQFILKHYEVEIKPKQEGYANYLNNLSQSYYFAQDKNVMDFNKSIDNMESSLFIIDPFVTAIEREQLWQQHQKYLSFCNEILDSKESTNTYQKVDSFITFKSNFRLTFYEILFKEKK